MGLIRGQLFIHIVRAKKLYNADGISRLNKSDPYVKISIDNATVAKTKVLQNTLNPKWDEHFLVDVCHEGATLDMQVLDQDLIGNDDLGMLKIPLQRLIDQKQVDGEYILTRKGKKCTGRLTFSLTLYNMEDLDRTRKVQNCYFDQNHNCKVTLYQDACAKQHPLLEASGYKRQQAFDDMFNAIQSACTFIYITGWSVRTGIKLRRDHGEEEVILGELLKAKAEEGVKVLIMVWNEVTSTSLTAGLMGTYDQETAEYFNGSKVKCFKVSRSITNDKAKNIVESNISAMVYTHHQKTVICDAPGSYVKNKLVAFVGGLDLTQGRYDTTDHNIFNTLPTLHKDDFYNVSATLENEQCGPRQPWHDIHAKIEGSAVIDVLKNFTERWARQNPNNLSDLVDINEDHYDLINKYHGEDKWNVQIFRSISKESAVFSKTTKKLILTQHCDTVFESTIQKSYIHNIRRSRHFIYIENQYFLGSCHMWNNLTGPKKAVHLIPVAITMRIVDAIKQGEEFCVYVVLPMYPEGDPTSAATQEILYYQYSTISMMYNHIANTLKEHGSDKLPTDYLSFFAIGKREQDITDSLPNPEGGSRDSVLRKSGRFMIYVHSKMAIFDDEYIIVGSANINQRSMSGKRDTEIAMGACQMNHRATDSSMPDGDIAKFRKSLLVEHTNKEIKSLEIAPGRCQTMRDLRTEAQNNWDKYMSESDTPDGHLLLYPYEVSVDGKVSAVIKYFPDTEAKIIGSENMVLGEKITT